MSFATCNILKKETIFSYVQESTFHSCNFLFPLEHVNSIEEFVLNQKKKDVSIAGFHKGFAPLSYLRINFKEALITHTSSIAWNYLLYNKALRFLLSDYHFIEYNLNIQSINLSDAGYIFNIKLYKLSMLKNVSLSKIPKIKLPQRKKYKDLDKQAEHLICTEKTNRMSPINLSICPNDWIYIKVTLCNDLGLPIIENEDQYFWYQISSESIDKEMKVLFENKKIKDVFLSNTTMFQDFFAQDRFGKYFFTIEIIDHLSSHSFNIDLFQSYFDLKNSKDVFNKFIEAFSSRNDISLAREISQIILDYVQKYIKISLPIELIEKQKEIIFERLKYNPDYLLYQSEIDFKNKVERLASKQVEDLCLIDFIAFQEKIEATDGDIKLYLNILQRNRLKEFIYFDLPKIKKNETSALVSKEILMATVRREKTLIYLINLVGK